jgi:hypothetical protein
MMMFLYCLKHFLIIPLKLELDHLSFSFFLFMFLYHAGHIPGFLKICFCRELIKSLILVRTLKVQNRIF